MHSVQIAGDGMSKNFKVADKFIQTSILNESSFAKGRVARVLIHIDLTHGCIV